MLSGPSITKGQLGWLLPDRFCFGNDLKLNLEFFEICADFSPAVHSWIIHLVKLITRNEATGVMSLPLLPSSEEISVLGFYCG
jgi:hypothetical protein